MEVVVLLVPGVVLSLVYLLRPLVAESIETPWDRFGLLGSDTEGRSDAAGADPGGRRAMTDGGRVCHSCGARVEGEYLYCAECLTPRV